MLLRFGRAGTLPHSQRANFVAAIAFQIASTNLAVELGIVMALLLGWQFVAGDYVGGPIMIVFVALLFRAFLTPPLLAHALVEADKGRLGSMEGHAEMDMSVGALRRLFRPAGFTATADSFVMDWAAVVIIPILDIYRRYYGRRMAAFIFVTF